MTSSWRDELGLPAGFHRLGAEDPVRAQMLWEALTRRPDTPAQDDLASIPDRLGPWRIARAGDGFAWTVADAPTATDRLRRRLRDWRTERPAGATRLVLVGESAAASWGFKAEYCLSSILESTLAGALDRPVEVVDLTLVNAVWDRDCLPAVHAAMTLDPDVFVVYCGNNEARWLLPSLAHFDVDGVTNGFSARWSFLLDDPEQRIAHLREAFAERLAVSLARTIATVRAFGKEIVFVVPGSNLRDWRPPEGLPHHLSGPALGTWSREMEGGRPDRAVAVDGGMCQRSLYELGQAQLADDPEAAALTLDRAMSAGLGPFVNAVPSLPSFGRARIVELLRAFKVPFVDLHGLLHRAAGGPPGREHFLDYCHLSAAGHEALTGEIVRSLLRFTSLRKLGAHSETVAVPGPGAHEAALAALLAGIHNFQNAQAEDVVEGWLRQAAQHPQVCRIMELLRDTVTTSHRERLTVAALRETGIVDAFLNDRYLIFGLKFLYHERFDVDLQRLLARVLPPPAIALDPPAPARSLNSLFFLDRRMGFGLTEREMSRRGWEQLGQDFVAYDRVGDVDFPAVEGTAVVRLVASPPWPGAAQAVRVSVNGKPAGGGRIGSPYTQLELPARLNGGVNRLRFEWDELFCPEDLVDPDERRRYWLGRGPYPVAAVLHELSVLPGGE